MNFASDLHHFCDQDYTPNSDHIINHLGCTHEFNSEVRSVTSSTFGLAETFGVIAEGLAVGIGPTKIPPYKSGTRAPSAPELDSSLIDPSGNRPSEPKYKNFGTIQL